MTPNDPIDKGDLLNIIKWVVIGFVVIALVLAAMAGFGQLNVDNVITLLTILAIALPIYYFVMMLRSSKVTKVERSRVKAYIPLFFAAAIFWGIEESGSVVLALFAAQRTVLHMVIGTLQQPTFSLLTIIHYDFNANLRLALGNIGKSSQQLQASLQQG